MADAIIGADVAGKNETKKKDVRNAEFAADCPANAKLSPICPTCIVSSVMTIGAIARLPIAGRAVETISLSLDDMTIENAFRTRVQIDVASEYILKDFGS
jgi:hypothetical protein